MASRMKVGLCEPSGKVTVNLRQQQGTRSRGRAHPELVRGEAIRLGWEVKGKRRLLSKRALRNKPRVYIRRLKKMDDSDSFRTAIRLGLFSSRVERKPTTKKKCSYRTPRRKCKAYVLVSIHGRHTNDEWEPVNVMEAVLSKYDLSSSLLVSKAYHGVTKSMLGNLRRYSSGLRDMYLSDRIGPKSLQPVAKPAC